MVWIMGLALTVLGIYSRSKRGGVGVGPGPGVRLRGEKGGGVRVGLGEDSI